ncbi:hypothetical protein DFH09DRAFT_469160 [Mycena vulgaris]|nr:hypothetical protein DFH09DRAFT_469160 [Mycena vulgaris]
MEGVMETLNSIGYPILTLPTEITSEIFLHCIDSPRVRFTHDDCYSPLLLASVCRAWRATAISTHGLWTHFCAGINHSHGWDVSALLKCWLPRAGSLPLDLELDLPKNASQNAILSILAQHSSQFRSLDLISFTPISFPIRTSFSSLERLKIQIRHSPGERPTCIDAFLDAPQLREADIDSLPPARISLPWIQLTHLKLCGQPIAECLDILSRTQNLETLTYGVIFSRFGAVASPPRILHPLRTIALWGIDTSHLLNHLLLPALEQLELSRPYHVAYAEVRSFIERSGCSLRSLCLSNPPFTELSTLISSLSLTSLAEFTISFPEWSADHFGGFFHRMAQSPYPLPALECLNIYQCRSNIDLRPLETMLAARWTGIPGAAKLKSFRLTLADAYQEVELESSVKELLHLRAQGLMIDIPSLPKWSVNSQMVRALTRARKS